MAMLIAGVVIWCAVHLMPSVLPTARTALTLKLGEGPYKGLFALSILAGIVLIVLGWRSTVPNLVYLPPAWGYTAVKALMLPALILMAGASMKTNLKRFIRHPQLTGVIVWAIAHLLANGDIRSVILFGGLGLWALLEIVLISRREGSWQRPGAVPLVGELKPVVAGVVAYAALMWLHPYLFGVAVVG